MTVNFDQQKLIKEAINGSEVAFESLILSCKGKAYSIAYTYLKNEEDAMDALQDSFVKIYRNLEKFKAQSKFETWVYRIVVNTCNDYLRKQKNKPVYENLHKSDGEGEYTIEIVDTSPGPEDILQQNEEGKLILECLYKLDDTMREILILRDVKGFAYDEIVEILQISIGTVKSRIFKARNQFKEIYLSQNIKT